QIAAGVNTLTVHFFCGDPAHPVYFLDRQPQYEVLYGLRSNDRESIGLLPVTGDFGEEFVRCDTGGNGDSKVLENPCANFTGDQSCAAVAVGAIGNVKKSLIE